MSYVLIFYIITSYGAVTTQIDKPFASYDDCATEAVARVESQRQLYPDAWIKWECERK